MSLSQRQWRRWRLLKVVLEGGVRTAGDKIRITTQLVDAITGRHLWAERYDGMLGRQGGQVLQHNI